MMMKVKSRGGNMFARVERGIERKERTMKAGFRR